jgi:hypothetical protein
MLTTDRGLLKNIEQTLFSKTYYNNIDEQQLDENRFDFVACVVVAENVPTCYCNFCRPIMNAVRYCIDQSYLIGLMDLDWHSKDFPENCFK